MRPRALAYYSVPGHVPEGQVHRWRAELRTFALQEGLEIAAVYVDRVGTGGAGFGALIEALRRRQVRFVVVPSLDHLTRVVGDDGRLAKSVLEHRFGVRVCSVAAAGRRAGRA